VNLVGKTFTVVIFVLSLAFMTLTIMVYATSKNWKDVVESTKATLDRPYGLNQQLKELQERNTELTTELEKTNQAIQFERDTRLNLLTKLEREFVDLQRERQQREGAKVAKTDELRKAVDALQAAEDQTAALDKDATGLRSDVETARQDRRDLEQKVLRLTDEDQQLKNELRILRDRQTILSADLEKARQLPPAAPPVKK
jgi:chromosome segregation ATPase